MIASGLPESDLNRIFAALADPIRRAILDRLAHGPATVGELAAPHKVTGAAITKHLKVLEAAGLLVQVKRAQWRHCHVKAEGLNEARKWIEDRQAFWNQQFGQLDDYLKSVE